MSTSDASPTGNAPVSLREHVTALAHSWAEDDSKDPAYALWLLAAIGEVPTHRDGQSALMTLAARFEEMGESAAAQGPVGDPSMTVAGDTYRACANLARVTESGK